MLIVNAQICVPLTELHWSYARSGGPGGQNVNKVASKVLLRWDLAGTESLPPDVKARLQSRERGRITNEGELVLTSQRHRDQERNRQDCLDKLREMILKATHVPRPRKPTKPSRGAKEARLRTKQRRSAVKQRRRIPAEE